jgi:hypothetical protein
MSLPSISGSRVEGRCRNINDQATPSFNRKGTAYVRNLHLRSTHAARLNAGTGTSGSAAVVLSEKEDY